MQKDRDAFFVRVSHRKSFAGQAAFSVRENGVGKLIQKAQNSGGVFLTVHILAAVAQHEREIISARTIRSTPGFVKNLARIAAAAATCFIN